MLGVYIQINERVLYARTAVNLGRCINKRHKDDCRIYAVDTGEFIHHKRSDGAVELARKLLDTIKEQK